MAQILVVDDDRELRGLVEFRLRRAGKELVAAGDGPSALALVDEHGAPDLAVLDIVMPGVSGIELLGELRERDGRAGFPRSSSAPAFLPEHIAAGRRLGATYLTEPFVAPALMAAVTASLRPAGSLSGNLADTVAGGPAPADWTRPAPVLPRAVTSRPPPGS